MRVTYSECMSVALLIRRAMRMRRVMSPVACLVVPRIFHIITQTARLMEKRY